jgi:carbon-monoxide dehydrogenase iron sulfur subunit
MYKDEISGLVLVNEDKCISCSTCIVACPYGVIRQDIATNRILKCDMCKGLETPACVANCPNEALAYGEGDE